MNPVNGSFQPVRMGFVLKKCREQSPLTNSLFCYREQSPLTNSLFCYREQSPLTNSLFC
uniref:Uncharacterized protein n=1 Tax=Anguilla anguilla TaxID=7936 RepID=A0A0E9XIY3_ANGAN